MGRLGLVGEPAAPIRPKSGSAYMARWCYGVTFGVPNGSDLGVGVGVPSELRFGPDVDACVLKHKWSKGGTTDTLGDADLRT